VNLQQLRDFCRAQLDVDEEEYPNALIDTYLTEAYIRTMAMETEWPFLEHRWVVTKPAGVNTIDIPSDCDPAGIRALIDDDSNYRLTQIGNELAEDSFNSGALVARSLFYSLYGTQIVLWPSATSDVRTYRLRGQRMANGDWINGGAGAEPDCDVRMHMLLAHYAIALMYANQEDEVLEDVYMKRWQAGFAAIRHAIMAPRTHSPVVLNGGLRSMYPIVPPVVLDVP
jgi:hypothetical protein